MLRPACLVEHFSSLTDCLVIHPAYPHMALHLTQAFAAIKVSRTSASTSPYAQTAVLDIDTSEKLIMTPVNLPRGTNSSLKGFSVRISSQLGVCVITRTAGHFTATISRNYADLRFSLHAPTNSLHLHGPSFQGEPWCLRIWPMSSSSAILSWDSHDGRYKLAGLSSSRYVSEHVD